QDMAHVELTRWVREHLEHVRLVLLGRGRITRVRAHEGAGLVPDLLPLALDCVRVVCVHVFPGLETEKPLVREAVRKLRGGLPRSLPRLRKEQVHLRWSLVTRCGAVSAAAGRVPTGCVSGTHLPPRCRRGYRRTCDA